MEDHRYRPDAACARTFASEAAIEPSIPPTEFVRPVESLEPKKSFLTFAPVSEKQKHAAELIEQGVDRLLSDPNAFYRFSGTFHTYSLPNQLLIMMQRPDATRCASMKTWNDLGRRVTKGAHGLAIFYPLFGREREIVDDQTGEIRKHKPLVVQRMHYLRARKSIEAGESDYAGDKET